MTRKDFILIAEIIIAQINTTSTSAESLIAPAIAKLKEANPAFDSQKFRNYILKKI